MNSSQIKGYLKELCLIPGLSGYEDNVRKYLQQQLNSINLKNTTNNILHFSNYDIIITLFLFI